MLHPATIRPATEGTRVAVVGDLYRYLATGDETGGKYAMMDALIPPGGGPPPHVHSREEEAFFVLEGVITFRLDGQPIVAGPNTFLNMPIGSVHSFKNESDQPARMLITVAPAGLEKMFLEVGKVLTSPEEQPQPPTEEEIHKLLEVAPKYGVEIRLPHQRTSLLTVRTMQFMLVVLLLFVAALFLLSLVLKKLGELVVVVIMLHFLILLTAPGDTGRWAALALFLLGCFDSGLWLFRRELSSMVQREDRSGLVTRFSIVVSPIAIAFLATMVLSVLQEIGAFHPGLDLSWKTHALSKPVRRHRVCQIFSMGFAVVVLPNRGIVCIKRVGWQQASRFPPFYLRTKWCSS